MRKCNLCGGEKGFHNEKCNHPEITGAPLSCSAQSAGSPDCRLIIERLLDICENGHNWTSPQFMEEARSFLKANDQHEGRVPETGD